MVKYNTTIFYTVIISLIDIIFPRCTCSNTYFNDTCDNTITVLHYIISIYYIHAYTHVYIDIIILHYYITLLQAYYITPLRHILYALSILPHNEYSLRTIFIHYSIISLYTSDRTMIHSLSQYLPQRVIPFLTFLITIHLHSSILRYNNL